jgi:hypothetical protein
MSRLPSWARSYSGQVADAAGRLRGDQVLVVRRLQRTARLQDELQPGGLVVAIAPCGLELLDASSRKEVEELQRGRPPGALVRAVVVREVDGSGFAFDGGAT